MARKIHAEDLSLEVMHPHAGIDIGNEIPLRWPCLQHETSSRCGASVAPPPELKAMAAWLKQCEIRTVAMQSTGMYWIAA